MKNYHLKLDRKERFIDTIPDSNFLCSNKAGVEIAGAIKYYFYVLRFKVINRSEKIHMQKGRLFWITGLSGAGKTTIGTLLYQHLRKGEKNIVFIDGDKIREVYQNKDYSEEGREKISYTNMRLCKMLTEQGLDVIIAVIGMRDAYREWNRKNIQNYFEIYLEVPIEILIARDSKGLYSKALRHEITNVYGIDMPYEEPKMPDVKICNDSSKTPEEVCQVIIDRLNL